MSYTVEVLNLGKRPMPGVDAAHTSFDDESEAVQAHCAALGDLALHDGMTVKSAERRASVGEDGIMAAAVLTHATDGGRVEVLLRRRAES